VTQCLYPSFERVRIYVAKHGDGYKIHDNGGAYLSAWAHGRDEPIINRALNQECKKYHLARIGDTLVAEALSREWLLSAILSVANASAAAATAAVARIVAAAEQELSERIEQTLIKTVGSAGFSKDVDIIGKSGGHRHFDFAIEVPDSEPILINGVSPHHGSISAKYVSFADTEGAASRKLAVFDRQLNTDDVALLQQVASILPIKGLARTTRGAIKYV
jgi:hypothetical protein